MSGEGGEGMIAWSDDGGSWRGYAPIYDRTYSMIVFGPSSPVWRNSPAIPDMIAADLVGLSGLEKNQKEECDSCIPRSRTTFKV